MSSFFISLVGRAVERGSVKHVQWLRLHRREPGERRGVVPRASPFQLTTPGRQRSVFQPPTQCTALTPVTRLTTLFHLTSQSPIPAYFYLRQMESSRFLLQPRYVPRQRHLLPSSFQNGTSPPSKQPLADLSDGLIQIKLEHTNKSREVASQPLHTQIHTQTPALLPSIAQKAQHGLGKLRIRSAQICTLLLFVNSDSASVVSPPPRPFQVFEEHLWQS